MERKQVLKALFFATASVGVAFLAKEAVNFIDDVAHPTYVLRGNPAPLVEEPVWNRPTNWNRKIGDATLRIHIIDGRNRD